MQSILLPTSVIDQTVQLTFRYQTYFTQHLFVLDNPLLRDVVQAGNSQIPAKVLFVVDSGVCAHHQSLPTMIADYCSQYHATLRLMDTPLLLPGGEAVKNDPQYIQTLHQTINAHGLCRHSYIVAVGGGALLDMVGYAAATAHRGIRLIRVPTTVLSQNDSAVGVKNSVNAFGKKNFLGSFAPPYAVLNDVAFLTTLMERDWRSGIAEAIKVALIKDAAFFVFLEQQSAALLKRDMSVMEYLIYRCAELHLQHIATSGDPFENGSSRPLDFGHWAAHKLEQLTNYQLRHGEAVAIGIALDTTYAYRAGFLLQADWERVISLLVAFGFTLYTPELSEYLDQREDQRCLLQGLYEFREHLGGQLTITLLSSIGKGFEIHTIDESLLCVCIEWLRNHALSNETELKNNVFGKHKQMLKGEAVWNSNRLHPR